MNKDTLKTSFAKRLIKWYKKEKRALPFRENKDPYRVWLSEIILQQTQMEIGIKYYNTFIKSFSNIKSLANSSEKKVYSLWQGLGYYNRAKNLHKAAKIIIKKHKGVFPKNYDELIMLPGIGKYTAAAISSICYNEKKFVVDANVYRVLSRFFGINKDISRTSSYNYFIKLSEKLADEITDFGEYNESIMDFGGSVCLPKKPLCPKCIFKKECYAKEKNKVSTFPIKKRKIKIRKRFFNYLIIENRNQVLIKKRTHKDIWENLNEFYLNEGQDCFFKSKPLVDYGKDKIILVSEDVAKLSHQIIKIKFYKLEICDVNNLDRLKKSLNMVLIKKSDLNNYAFPKVINNYLKSAS
ncbi:MAG: A/G-specific adenine glycosylase [Cytophagales bacterium]|nr:A/G-specific adenine glycosylase [Cytophagales bacterium]